MAVAKGAATTVAIPMYDADDPTALKTGLTLTATVSKDGGAFAAATNSASELGTTGVYSLTLTADEMDADLVTVKVTATGACDQCLALVTDPTGLATASALAVVDGVVDAIKAKTDNLPSDPADQSELAALIAALPDATDVAALDALLDAVKLKTDQIGAGTISVVSPVHTDGTWGPLVAGDDYVAGTDSELSVKTSGIDLEGATVVCNIKPHVSDLACTVTPLVDDPDGWEYEVVVDELPAATTAKFGCRGGEFVREFERTAGSPQGKKTFGRSLVKFTPD